MMSGGKLGGGSSLAEKVRPQATCWEEGDCMMLPLCRHPPLRRRGPERRHCHGGKKKNGPEKVPREAQTGSAGSSRGGGGPWLALQWPVTVGRPWQGLLSAAALQLSRPFSFWAWLPGSPPSFSAATKTRGKAHRCLSPSPSLSWVSLCLCLSVSLSLSPESSTSFSPTPSSCCLEPGS